jgi:ribosomal protein S12 methylthiotransferase
MTTISIITLGCAKNIVDSERMGMQLVRCGYTVAHGYVDDAQIVIINTCGFITAAKEEAVNTILHYADLRQRGRIAQLFVVGCFSERYADMLRIEMPEVDEYFGVNSIEHIMKRLNAAYSRELVGERLVSTPAHYAYLKIAEGCSRQCSFCAIPMIRGRYVSSPLPALVDETVHLAQQGVRELILIAQDLTNYGIDIYGERQLPTLIDALSQVDGIEWIRLHYLYPAPSVQQLADVMNNNRKVCRYLDIPIQHANDKVLKDMQRGYSQRDLRLMVDGLRRSVPDIALRTTLMVGFPSETDEAFSELLSFVEEIKFDKLGVFAYSMEEGTPSAQRFADKVPQQTKQNRLHTIMTAQKQISLQLNQRRVGSRMKAIVERRQGDKWIARSQYDSPDIDGEIVITTAQPLQVGNFYDVDIVKAGEYDLFGTI